MKALVKVAPGSGHVELRDVKEPSPGPGQVKVEVKAAGICGSDIHILHADIKIPVAPPVVMGHEFAGVIAEIGPGVCGFRVGDRVTCETAAHVCGACLHCRTGNYNLCAEKQLIGYVFDGCFARYCLVSGNRLHLLPDNVDFAAAAQSEPLACCVHAVLELTHVVPGDVVLIAGPGPIGLLCLQLVIAQGGRALVAGTSDDELRLGKALQLGAEGVIDVQKQDVRERLLAVSGAAEADVYLECSGSAAAARLGLAMTRRGGQYTQVGLLSKPFELDFGAIAYKELRVTGSFGQKWTAWKRGLLLLGRGQVDTGSLVSHLLPLERWEEAFAIVEGKRGLKVILQP